MAAQTLVSWLHRRPREPLAAVAVSPTNSLRPRSAYLPLLWVLGAIISGAVADRCLGSIPASIWWFGAVAAQIAWWLAIKRQVVRVAACLLLLSCAAAAAAWHHVRWNLFERDHLGMFASRDPTPVCIEATALTGPRYVPPRRRDPLSSLEPGARTRLLLRVTGIRDGRTWRSASGDTWLTVDGQVAGVHAGDQLRVIAALSAPDEPANPGDFDFASYYRADRQLCRLWAQHPAAVRVMAPATPGLSRWLDQVRQRADRLIWSQVDPSRAPLASALLLGLREQLDPDAVEPYLVTGMVHIMSISGMHVGLLALGLFGLLRLGLIRRATAAVCVAALIVGYALLVQAEPPAIRATVTLLLGCAAMIVGRRASMANLLAGAAVLVILMNPADLFRAGPQLSFLCTAALAVCELGRRRRTEDALERHIAESAGPLHQAWHWLRDASWATFWMSAAVWFVALPLIATQFHLVSPIGMLLTPLLALPTAAALLSGFLLVFVGSWIPATAAPLGWCCDRSLAMVEGCVQWGSATSWGHWWTPGLSAFWLTGFYLVWIVALAWPSTHRWKRLAWSMPMVWFAVALAATARGPGNTGDALRVTFLSVGHGCAVVLELPDRRTWLYDAGRMGMPETAAASVSNYLWWRGTRQLEAVAVSHFDTDHYNAVPELLRRFSIGQVYLPAQRHTPDEPTTILLRALESAGVPRSMLTAGDRLQLSADCTISVLHPPSAGVNGTDNANSLVWLIEYQGRRVLLPGDLESPGLEGLLAEPAIDCDIVLAPHHGSARSDPPGFAAWSTPEFVVFSGGRGPDLQAVEAAYARQGAARLHTARDGAITFTIRRAGIDVSTWLGDQR